MLPRHACCVLSRLCCNRHSQRVKLLSHQDWQNRESFLAALADTRPRIPLISFCTVQLRTLCAAHSLAILCLSTTSGPGPGEFPGFWGSMVFRHASIPRKGSGNNNTQLYLRCCVYTAKVEKSLSLRKRIFSFRSYESFQNHINPAVRFSCSPIMATWADGCFL